MHCIYSDFFRLCLLNTVTWFVFSPFSWKHITSSIWMAKPSGNNNACSLNHNKWSSLSKNCSRWCVSFPQMYKCRKKSHVNVPRWRLPTGSEIYFQQENTISSFTQRLTAWCCFSWAHLGIQMVMASRVSLTKRNFRKKSLCHQLTLIIDLTAGNTQSALLCGIRAHWAEPTHRSTRAVSQVWLIDNCTFFLRLQ